MRRKILVGGLDGQLPRSNAGALVAVASLEGKAVRPTVAGIAEPPLSLFSVPSSAVQFPALGRREPKPEEKPIDSGGQNCYGNGQFGYRKNGPPLPLKNAGHKSERTNAYAMSGPEQATYSQLYRATLQQLTVFRERVAENKDLSAANDFARYVLNSRILSILAPHDSPEFLKVDSAFLRWTAEELRREVCDKFRGGQAEPQVSRSVLESINHKLDLIAAEVGRRGSGNSKYEPPEILRSVGTES